ncbi:hypothetical protein B0H14DRAFT_2611126 [Mycena olivaceomarginata]|nr:hypothetical protein B0H14DRAFT_2611126 [Mycena olivaceomarginata]
MPCCTRRSSEREKRLQWRKLQMQATLAPLHAPRPPRTPPSAGPVMSISPQDINTASTALLHSKNSSDNSPLPPDSPAAPMMVLGLLNISVTGSHSPSPFLCQSNQGFACHGAPDHNPDEPAFLDYFAPIQPPPHYSSLPLDVFLDGSWIATTIGQVKEPLGKTKMFFSLPAVRALDSWVFWAAPIESLYFISTNLQQILEVTAARGVSKMSARTAIIGDQHAATSGLDRSTSALETVHLGTNREGKIRHVARRKDIHRVLTSSTATHRGVTRGSRLDKIKSASSLGTEYDRGVRCAESSRADDLVLLHPAVIVRDVISVSHGGRRTSGEVLDARTKTGYERRHLDQDGEHIEEEQGLY